MKLPILAFTAAIAAGTAAFAAPIALPGTEGLSVIAGGGEVIATYQGTTAAYSNDLYLDNGDDDYTNDLFLFNNQTSAVGSTFNLGSFASGTELLFRLFVNNTLQNYFTGPASRNPDGVAHARVQSDWEVVGTTLVSFEDLFNGPFDYNDLSFSFTNTSGEVIAPVPLPAGGLLLLAALGGLAVVRRRKS